MCEQASRTAEARIIPIPDAAVDVHFDGTAEPRSTDRLLAGSRAKKESRHD